MNNFLVSKLEHCHMSKRCSNKFETRLHKEKKGRGMAFFSAKKNFFNEEILYMTI